MQLTDAEMHLFYAFDMIANTPEPGEEQDFYREQLEIGRMMMREQIINEITGAASETTKEELDGRR